jgi:hypothetical protein
MKTETGIENKIDSLLDVLKNDIEHIRQSLLWLTELRSLVVKRDEEGLGELLEYIQKKSGGYSANESKRQLLRKELAEDLGCDIKEVTLTRLEKEGPVEKRKVVSTIKAELKTLTEELKREHLSVTMLLSDCARFNSLLLRSLLDMGRAETVTYSANGTAMRQGGMSLLNLRF